MKYIFLNVKKVRTSRMFKSRVFHVIIVGPGWLNELGRWIQQIMQAYHQYGARLAAASDNVYQLLAHVRWFSPGTPASSTTKTGRHDIAEILLKVALKHQKSKNQKNLYSRRK